MFPVSGGGGLFTQYAFGNLAGASFGWFAYLQAAAYAPIEVLAAIQYLSTATWASGFYNARTGPSAQGIGVAVALMIIFLIINLIGIRWVERTNNGLTIVKVVIPLRGRRAPDHTFPPRQLHRRWRLLPKGVAFRRHS